MSWTAPVTPSRVAFGVLPTVLETATPVSHFTPGGHHRTPRRAGRGCAKIASIRCSSGWVDGSSSTPSSQFRWAPDSSFQRLSSSMGRWIRAKYTNIVILQDRNLASSSPSGDIQLNGSGGSLYVPNAYVALQG